MRRRAERGRLLVGAAGVLTIAMAACSSGDRLQPRIETISPESGDVAGGDPVTIVVRDFADDFTVDLPEVEFGGHPSLSITALFRDTVVATTPRAGAAGPVDVDVRGTAMPHSARRASGFTYTGTPQFPFITALSPPIGPVGTEVDVQGQFFSPTPMENVVRFNGIAAPIIASSATSILTVVPGGATSGPVNVEVVGVPSNDVPFIVSGPRITDLSPAFADYGDAVTITGEDFSPNPSDNIVRFHGTLAAVTASTATTIDTNVPAECITGPVTVEVAGLVSNEVWFCLGSLSTPPPTPTLISLSPPSGPAGASVTITGSDFSSTPSENVVRLSGLRAAATAASPGTLTVDVPSAATTGPVTVSVGGREATGSLSYTVTSPPPPPPAISALYADAGTVWDSVWIDGIEFDADPTNLRVEFDGEPARISSSADTSILVTVPLTSTGLVTVERGGQTSAGVPFTFTGPPAGMGTVDFFGRTFPIPGDRVIYVIDTSGSMFFTFGSYVDRFGNTVTGTRLELVQDRLISSIQALPGTARFNIFRYACNNSSWSSQTDPADAANKASAETWILGMMAFGGTGTGPAVSSALQERQNETVLLVSDGQPNCGASGTLGHTCVILNANDQDAVIHTFGISASGRFREFLEEIARNTNGSYTDIVP
ncbi:MAG: IPT/TIG domain-containing protein [Planctomycetota bacterium]|nr:IPT/TIG domain-containing protein [Planctomycetota bacterium]